MCGINRECHGNGVKSIPIFKINCYVNTFINNGRLIVNNYNKNVVNFTCRKS